MVSEPMPNMMRPMYSMGRFGCGRDDRGADRHQRREQQAGAARADAIDQVSTEQHGEHGRDAVDRIHRADRGAVGVEVLDQRGFDGADTVIGEVTAERHQAGEKQHRETVGLAGWIQLWAPE